MAEPNPLAEHFPPLTAQQALVEANRCLYCYDAPCTHACPTHIDVPRFIRQILHRDELSAARLTRPWHPQRSVIERRRCSLW